MNGSYELGLKDLYSGSFLRAMKTLGELETSAYSELSVKMKVGVNVG